MEWFQKHRKRTLYVAGYATLAILLDLASGAFVLQTGLAICYPPAGLYLAAILLLGWRALPLAFINPVFSVLVTLQSPDIPVIAVIGIGLASMVSPAIALALLRKFSPAAIRLYTVRDVAGFSFVLCFAVLVECLLAASVYVLTGLGAWETFGTIATGWWISNVIPYLVLTPVILLWYQGWSAREFLWDYRSKAQAVLILASMPFAILIAFSTKDNISVSRLYVALLPILWAALIGGITGAAWASLAMTAGVLVLAPGLMIEPELIVEAQFFLLASTLAGLFTGGIVTERRQAESALRESEEKYRDIFENAIDGIFQSAPDERFLKVNPAMAEMYGYGSPEAMIREVTNIASQLTVELRQRDELARRLTAGEKIAGFEMLNYRRDRSTFWTAVNIRAVRDAEGNILYYEGAVEDITKRKQALENIIASEEKYRSLVENPNILIITIDLDEKIQFMNHTVDGFTLEQVLDSNIYNFVPLEFQEVVKQTFGSVIKNKKPASYEIQGPGVRGPYTWYSTNVSPIFADGKVIGLTLLTMDITERKHAEAEQARLIAELESKNAELTRFVYTVSHDLKSPLVTINGYLGYIEEDARSGNLERLKKDTRRIQEATNKMHALLTELLELSRIGRVMNAAEDVPFADLVKEALDIVHGQLESRRVTVRTQPNLPTVHGDRQRLIEVLQNLLDNAAKYMGDQPEPLIEIGQQGEMDGKPTLFVKDNGMGIASEYHERVFGLFNKLDSSSDGTGIGLALVKRIIEVHEGKIWVESETGKGSTFYFTLPAK
ncbi:MAG: PAS domain S-box protein [Anaerolineales bacterium]|nr:PAS domain S-box protein [Anaerolineales bacterium]